MIERRLALHDVHVRAGAQMVVGGGDYLFPVSYTSPLAEHVNTRTNVGMQDLSSMGEIDIKGPGAERLLNQLLVNDIRDMDPGRVRYSTICDEDGGIIDDITVSKLHDEHFLIVTSSAPRRQTYEWIAEHAAGASAYVTDISATIVFLAVQGPRSRELLQTVIDDADLAALRFFRFTSARIGETRILVSRSGYTGELGYELLIPAEEAVGVWELLRSRGAAFELKPYGVAAMHTLRLEKSLPLYGPDISRSDTPFHLGLDRWIRFDKRTFIGRDALLKVAERGPDRRWVGLALDADAPAAPKASVCALGGIDPVTEEVLAGPRAGEPEDRVRPGGDVGWVTVSQWCPTAARHLAMAYVDTAHCWPGSRLVVRVGGRPVTAKVVATPFVDPGGARMKG
ncbi:MAG: aminomethyl transferase family protein [Pseudonocardiaceae bacterium]|nr:aminomethyl transferase family protein [Pseudonocardiaceae bacterium]